jgi:hypothetical protein
MDELHWSKNLCCRESQRRKTELGEEDKKKKREKAGLNFAVVV